MNCLDVDRSSLPAALLDLAKQHLRVRHSRDDLLIQTYVGQAIDAIERRCSINLNPADFELEVHHLDAMPCEALPEHMQLALPVNNVRTFTLTDGDGVDQSVSYAIEQSDLGGSGQAWLVGPPITEDDWLMTAAVGIEVATGSPPPAPDIAPAVLAAVLRMTGGYYENRESSAALAVDDYLNELIPIWRPSA
jgi:uncharacterized phiE125 gp8 family phage protein